MRRIVFMLALAGLLPLMACGGGGGTNVAQGALPGPFELALPVFGDGALKTLVLRNLATEDAPVKVTEVPGGAPTVHTVPATGELRLSVSVGEGWLIVDTRDAITQAALATSGFVEPYLWAQRSGPDGETAMAATFQSTEAILPVHPSTDRVLLLNHGPAGSFTFCEFTADGTLTVTPQLVAQDASFEIPLGTLNGTAGHFAVLPPPGPGAAYAVASLEDEDLVYESDDRVNKVSRLLDQGSSSLAGLVTEFGRDVQAGDVRDFDLLAANGSDQPASFTLLSVYDASGNALLATPRTVVLQPRQTRLYATTTTDSVGLQLGEVHPFADLFGDVFTSASLARYQLTFTIGQGVFLTGRAFDPFAGDFGARLRPTAFRHASSVLVSDAQTTTLGGIRNEVVLQNPSSGAINVSVRAFTETDGTEYVLPSFMVPGRSLYTWTPDALGLREIVGDVVSPPVRNLRFRFTSNAIFGLFARQRQKDAQGLIILVTPHIVRHED